MEGAMAVDEIGDEQRLRVLNRTRGVVLVAELALALDPWGRLRGLLGRPAPAEQAALLLRPCRSVHTFFMRYPIDVAFVDRTGRVVGTAARLLPWRVTPYHGDARATLELAAGRLERTGTQPGDELCFLRT